MNTRAFVPLVIVMALSADARDADDGSAAPRSKPSAESTTRSASHMKITLNLRDKRLTATLYNTPAARDFASMLPLTLTLEDHSKTEKISDLPKKLTREGAPAGADPSVGDIAYYAPWGNLAVFYKDFRYSDGLILLGKLDGGAETLAVPGPVEVTIELIDALFDAKDPARTSAALVTFEPGARTAWHMHPLGQRLFVTSGLGWTQVEGGTVQEIRPGDVVWCPPNVRHWHGATPRTAMSHIAIQESLNGKVVEWMEQVTDEQYAAGRADEAD